MFNQFSGICPMFGVGCRSLPRDILIACNIVREVVGIDEVITRVVRRIDVDHYGGIIR